MVKSGKMTDASKLYQKKKTTQSTL